MQGPPPVADPRHRPHQLARRRTSAPRALLSYRFRANAPPPRRSRPLLSWACAAALAVPAHQRAPPCKPSTPSIWGGLRSRLSIVGPRAGAPLEVAPPPLRFLAGSAASPKRRPAFWPAIPPFGPRGADSGRARTHRSRAPRARGSCSHRTFKLDRGCRVGRVGWWGIRVGCWVG